MVFNVVCRVIHYQPSLFLISLCGVQCMKPVIACVHSACVGGGVDMISACDIRLCSQRCLVPSEGGCPSTDTDSLTEGGGQEADLGLAADVGTLQRLPRVVGNSSWVRDVVYTARRVSAQEALQF